MSWCSFECHYQFQYHIGKQRQHQQQQQQKWLNHSHTWKNPFGSQPTLYYTPMFILEIIQCKYSLFCFELLVVSLSSRKQFSPLTGNLDEPIFRSASEVKFILLSAWFGISVGFWCTRVFIFYLANENSTAPPLPPSPLYSSPLPRHVGNMRKEKVVFNRQSKVNWNVIVAHLVSNSISKICVESTGEWVTRCDSHSPRTCLCAL